MNIERCYFRKELCRFLVFEYIGIFKFPTLHKQLWFVLYISYSRTNLILHVTLLIILLGIISKTPNYNSFTFY